MSPTAEGSVCSPDTIAIVVTVLLGLASYVLQAKLARDATHAEKDHDRVLAAREQERHAAGLLLERVRTQMTDVYRPLTAAHAAAEASMVYMVRELGFEWLWLTTGDSCFIRPSEQLYPHLEVFMRDLPRELFAHQRESRGATAWRKWSPGDLQLLADDTSKRDVYTDAYSSGMVPRWRDMAAIIRTKTALIEAPPPESLATANPAWSEVDWAKIGMGALVVHLFDMVAFTDAWAAIERRWAAGDYLVMQPAIPSPALLVLTINMIMTSAATAKEAELQGASSGHASNAVLAVSMQSLRDAVDENET